MAALRAALSGKILFKREASAIGELEGRNAHSLGLPLLQWISIFRNPHKARIFSSSAATGIYGAHFSMKPFV